MLRIADLSHTYPDGTVALDGVSLDIDVGLFGLLGPNGAGKSTLMRILATVQRPSAGRVVLDEVDLLAEPMRVRRVLGYLPQDFGAYPHVSALAMLDHIAVLKGLAGPERRETVERLLAAVGLWAHRRKPLSAMSGGMRQRFGIAQAMLGRPRLLIVDEPTAGLDPGERFRCLDLIAVLAEDAVVILSTHIVADAAALCARVAVLAGGRVLTAGAPAALVDALAGQVWRGEVARGDVAALRETGELLWAQLVGGRTLVHVRSRHAPPSFHAVAPSLEDAYFAAIGGERP